MNALVFLGGVAGFIFGVGGFYLLTNWRLKTCEDAIKLIQENHLVRIKNDIVKVRLTLAKITEKLDIADEPVED